MYANRKKEGLLMSVLFDEFSENFQTVRMAFKQKL